MDTRSMRPYAGDWQVARRAGGDDPFFRLHNEIDRLFGDVFRGFGLPTGWGAARGGEAPMAMSPSIELSETGNEIKVCAELPGIDEKDVEVTLDGDLLTIRGEKKVEREERDEGRSYHLSERSFGSFMRSIRLPAAPDPDKVQASFGNGVLTITMLKPEEVKQRTRRISVRAEPAASPQRAAGEAAAPSEQREPAATRGG